MNEKLLKIIQPIVDGQIRTFLKEHHTILECVVWFKPREDKATTFANSLGKRIVRDLSSDETAARLKTALVDGLPLEQGSGNLTAAGEGGNLGITAEVAADFLPPRDENDRLLDAERLLKNAGYIVHFPHHTRDPEDGWNYGRPQFSSMSPFPMNVIGAIVETRNGKLPVSNFEWFGLVPRFNPTSEHF